MTTTREAMSSPSLRVKAHEPISTTIAEAIISSRSAQKINPIISGRSPTAKCGSLSTGRIYHQRNRQSSFALSLCGGTSIDRHAQPPAHDHPHRHGREKHTPTQAKDSPERHRGWAQAIHYLFRQKKQPDVWMARPLS